MEIFFSKLPLGHLFVCRILSAILLITLATATNCDYLLAEESKKIDCEAASRLVRDAVILGDGSEDEASLYADAITKCPTFAEAHHNLGVIAAEIGKYSEAKLHFEKAVELKKDANFMHSLAYILYREGNLDEAEEVYKQALEKNPNSVVSHIGLANISYLNQDNDKAVKYLNDAKIIDPNNAELIKVLARTLEKAGKVEESISTLTTFLLKNKDEQAYQELSRIYLSQGQISKAITTLESALRLNPLSKQLNLFIATAYSKSEQYDYSLKHLKKIIKEDPEHSVAHANISLVYAKLKKYNKALYHAKRSITIEDNYEARMALGYVHTRLLNFKDARDSYKKALDLLPEELDQESKHKAGLAHYNLSIALGKLGNRRESERERNMAKALGVAGE